VKSVYFFLTSFLLSSFLLFSFLPISIMSVFVSYSSPTFASYHSRPSLIRYITTTNPTRGSAARSHKNSLLSVSTARAQIEMRRSLFPWNRPLALCCLSPCNIELIKREYRRDNNRKNNYHYPWKQRLRNLYEDQFLHRS
jgi:hypothetical protein